MSDKSLFMEVATPERLVISQEVTSIVLPATEGYLGVLSGHAALITSLDAGVVRYRIDGQAQLMAISGGFMEVKDNKAIILADTAEKADEINVERARRAKERAEKRLAEKAPDTDTKRAERALKRAIARLKSAGE